MRGAVAVDMGASSARLAFGRLEDGRLNVEFGERIPHQPCDREGRLTWDFDALLALAKRGAKEGYDRFGRATLGIDAWGVDHGFVDRAGHLIQPPVAYRDPSHEAVFDEMAASRERFFRLTGLQAQPFNTVYQLIARRRENPHLPETTHHWLPLPDLMGYLLTGEANVEWTQASTTGLQGLDGAWCDEIFAQIGWPVPRLGPRLPGELGGYVGEGVRLATVGSHDTASAVVGFGTLEQTDVFLNVGTWSLVGTVIDAPLVNDAVMAANLANERTADGRIRLLRNVPGTWVINRLHEELNVDVSVPEWLATARRETDRTLDLFDAALFNPESMVSACDADDLSPHGCAELALRSLVTAIADQIPILASVTGRAFRRIRVAGGGSQSSAFCQSLADASGLIVEAGPVEATVMGNLATQFLAQGVLKDWDDVRAVLDRVETARYVPESEN